MNAKVHNQMTHIAVILDMRNMKTVYHIDVAYKFFDTNYFQLSLYLTVFEVAKRCKKSEFSIEFESNFVDNFLLIERDLIIRPSEILRIKDIQMHLKTDRI